MIEKGLKVVLVVSDLGLLIAFILAFFQSRYGFPMHMASAGVAILVSFFANSCAIFYFVGTGVWIRDEAKALAVRNREAGLQVWSLYEKANKLKGKAFPLPSLNIALALFTFILGGAIQVGAVSAWVHVTLATVFVISSFFSTRLVFSAMKSNMDLLNQTTTLTSKD